MDGKGKTSRKALALFLACSVVLAACAGGGQKPADPDGDQPGGDLPGGDPPVTQPYEYGADHADAYDGDYTQSLLSLGDQVFTRTQLSGTDATGRKLNPTSAPKDGKYVGLFYFLWLNSSNYPYDISKLLEEYGEYDTKNNPLWALAGSAAYNAALSPMNAFHYFEEPFYGYYTSEDKWVIMRHLELLTYAGIDFLYLDFTNASPNGTNTPNNIYTNATYALMDCILEMQALGFDVPKIVPVVCNPYTGTGSAGDAARSKVVEWVYHNYYNYENGKYKSCWFTADEQRNPSGKPMLVTYTINRNDFLNKAAYDAFWFRNVVWPTQVNSGSYANGFPWMDYVLPQENYNGFMNVSIAQHLEGHWSSEAFLARSEERYTYTYRGRSASGSMRYAYESDDKELANYGNNFAEQWDNAVNAGNKTGKDEVWLVTVTGWNEWVAQKFDQGMGHATFVDTFDVAFSRDIEMMRDSGGYADNYYMQLAENVARFKASASERQSDAAMWKKQTLKYDDLAAWQNVQAKFVDLSGGVKNRNAKSVGGVYTYTDTSARNDVEYVKIANDSEYLYVLAKTKQAVTAYEAGDDCWMNLYLSTGAKGGWENYNFVINRSPSGEKTSIERLSVKGGKIYAEPLETRADLHTENDMISYRIPLEAIGVTSAYQIGVKVCDNLFANRSTKENDGVCCFTFGDPMAFYGGGECAPIGRLNYTYRLAY